MSKTWFITGSSRGMGRAWAEAALERGDRVVATARDVAKVADLAERFGDTALPMALDVTDRDAAFAAVQRARDHFGRLDVVVNNAGYGLFGAVEETTEQEARDQFETNVFGALWVTQAAIPIIREQGGGHILQVSSAGGVEAFPRLGVYNATKFALEGFSQALADEIALFGGKVTIIEPGPVATDWAGDSAAFSAPLDAYQPLRDGMEQMRRDLPPAPGPEATVAAVLKVVDADEPPLRLLLGSVALGMALNGAEKRIATWKAWEATSRSADLAPA